MIDLSSQVTQGDTVWNQNLNWTAPTDSNYVVFGLWTEGTAHSSSPAAETSYATNYFDTRGIDALKAFWEEHYLNDPESVSYTHLPYLFRVWTGFPYTEKAISSSIAKTWTFCSNDWRWRQ